VDAEYRELTELQQKLVLAYTTNPACIGKVKESAIAAGYSPKTAHEIGRQTLALPHVKAAVMRANYEQISGQAATKAVALLETVVDDEKAPLRLRVDAAKTILDRAGLSAAKPQHEADQDLLKKDLSAMRPEELNRFVREAGDVRRKLEARLAALTQHQH
jgi:phage terminase small subunit